MKNSTLSTRLANVAEQSKQACCRVCIALTYSGQNEASVDFFWRTFLCLPYVILPSMPNHDSLKGKSVEKCLVSVTHHYLNLTLADLEIVFVVDVHPLQSTTNPLVCLHEEHDCKATCMMQRNDTFKMCIQNKIKTSILWTLSGYHDFEHLADVLIFKPQFFSNCRAFYPCIFSHQKAQSAPNGTAL